MCKIQYYSKSEFRDRPTLYSILYEPTSLTFVMDMVMVVLNHKIKCHGKTCKVNVISKSLTLWGKVATVSKIL